MPGFCVFPRGIQSNILLFVSAVHFPIESNSLNGMEIRHILSVSADSTQSDSTLKLHGIYVGVGVAVLCSLVMVVTLSWCVFRQRRDHLKPGRNASSSSSRHKKGASAAVNGACSDLGDKSSPSDDLDDRDSKSVVLDSPLHETNSNSNANVDPTCCWCCCTYTGSSSDKDAASSSVGCGGSGAGGDDIGASRNPSLPFAEESYLKPPSTLTTACTEEAPSIPSVPEGRYLTMGSTSLPSSPSISALETHPFRVQVSPKVARPIGELGLRRANLMESSCSAGDIQQQTCRENDPPTTATTTPSLGAYSEEPPKTKNRSLLELRRGPRAALVLNLHSGASSSPSPFRTTLLGATGSAEDNHLLFSEHPFTSYSTFDHQNHASCSPLRPSDGQCLPVASVKPYSSFSPATSANSSNVAVAAAAAAAATAAVAAVGVGSEVTANLSPRPMTGEEPSRIADRVTLRTASLPLTAEALEAKLGPGGEDHLYKEFWDIPMNFANKSDCPWVGVCQKNRYHEVLPHNNTRVVLPAINNDDMTSYINANYIRGYQGRPQAFIATQGPMSHTINDFWRMVWHSRTPAVVMLTKICEQDKRTKCDLYLPTSKHESSDRGGGIGTPVRADTVPAAEAVVAPGAVLATAVGGGGPTLHSAASMPAPTPACWGEDFSRTCSPVGAQRFYGAIHVRVISVTQRDSYTERKLILKMDGEERRVTHYWFVGWSDHASPEATLESARSLLDLVHEIEACRHNQATNSLPSTPAPSLEPSSVPPAPVFPRLLSRQAAEDWSDADYDLRFPPDQGEQVEAPAPRPPSSIAFKLFTPDASSTPGSRSAYRASDPAPLIGTGGEFGGGSGVGPVVVHCSAGVGRTGCFIALCIGCEQLRREGKVDVLGIVSRLRLDRGGMVENSEQYTFLHAALCLYNAIRSGRELPVLPAITNLRNQFTGPLR